MGVVIGISFMGDDMIFLDNNHKREQAHFGLRFTISGSGAPSKAIFSDVIAIESHHGHLQAVSLKNQPEYCVKTRCP